MLLFMMYLVIFFYLNLNNNMTMSLLIFMNNNLSMDFNLNMMNSIFSMTVCLITLGILFYSKMYFLMKIPMKYKINLMIFVMSMILLINSNNLISMMIGWDGLGISSFYLVSFYSNINSSISSLVTFFFNRLGDSFILVFMCIMMNYSIKLNMINMSIVSFIMLFLSITTKSSQIPFGVWLPYAMSAPTPISSLVHSSTLVTAGIFLIMKMNFIFNLMEIQLIMMNFGMLTFVMGGIFSISVMDMKKAIAFSTFSQLGFIMFSLSLGNLTMSFYHLIFHAFFKSSLFVNLGFMMISNYSIQDLRQMTMNKNLMIPKVCFLISCLNLMGFMSTSGFLSKDMILLFFFNKTNKIIIKMMLYLGCMLTVMYSMKLIMVMINNSLFNLKIIKNMNFSLLFMSFLFSNFLILLIPNLMINIMFFNYSMDFIFLEFKIKFYMIILFSLLLIKFMMFKINFTMMMFSSMIMIFDAMNYLLLMIYKMMMKKFLLALMVEEFIQMSIFSKFISNMLLKLNLTLILMNMMFTVLIMMLFWYKFYLH